MSARCAQGSRSGSFRTSGAEDSPIGDSLVLAYHAVSTSWSSSLAVSPELFRRQVGGLIDCGRSGVTFAQLVRGEAGERAFAVTFDDGYRSVYRQALPILAELGIPATVFVPTSLVGRSGPMAWPGIAAWLGTEHEGELLPLSWEELGELQALGWEVGSHTRTHPRLTELDDDDLAMELRGSREDCGERLGTPCLTLAFPYGAHDDRVSGAAQEAGYEAAASMRPFGSGRYGWPRIGVYPVDRGWRFRLKTSAHVRRLRRSRLGIALESARGAAP